MSAKLSRDEIQGLIATVAAVCDRYATEDRVREVAYCDDATHDGFDTELWTVLCQQVGVAAMTVPEDQGGAEAGTTALGAVAEQLGRVVAPVPFVASAVLATGLLLDAAPQPVLDAWLPSLMAGTRTAAAVLSGDGGLWRPDAIPIRATPGNPELNGTARHVLHAGAADLLVVAALADGAVELFALDAADPGVSITPEPTLDGTRPMATVSFTNAGATHLTSTAAAAETVARNIDRALAVLSAEQVGTCARVLEVASEYARTRHQFGRPIGSFQAVKHACSNILVDLEWSRSASQAALESIDDSPDNAPWRSSMAKAVCSEALRNATHANVQIHGGIGFTWENSAHLFLKRARTDEVIFGGPGEHWDRLATESSEIFAS